jgi:hypothetical protein
MSAAAGIASLSRDRNPRNLFKPVCARSGLQPLPGLELKFFHVVRMSIPGGERKDERDPGDLQLAAPLILL